MQDTVLHEVELLAVAVTAGVLMMASYDILRILRGIFAHSYWKIAIEDMIYWGVCTVYLFLLFYKKNHGIMRLIFFLAIAAGMLGYDRSISPFIVGHSIRLGKKTRQTVKKYLKKLYKMIRIVISRL